MTENSTIHFSYRVSDADQTRHLGEELAHHLRAGDLIMLRGGLGAGKTTLTQGIGRGLGVRGTVASPTFIVARVHPSLVGDGYGLRSFRFHPPHEARGHHGPREGRRRRINRFPLPAHADPLRNLIWSLCASFARCAG